MGESPLLKDPRIASKGAMFHSLWMFMMFTATLLVDKLPAFHEISIKIPKNLTIFLSVKS